MVPLGDTAKAAVARWLECRDSHPVFMLSDMMFPAENGRAMTRQAFAALLKARVAADLDPAQVIPHKLRHSFATHMLNRGVICEACKVYLAMPTLPQRKSIPPIARPVGQPCGQHLRLPHGGKIDKLGSPSDQGWTDNVI